MRDEAARFPKLIASALAGALLLVGAVGWRVLRSTTEPRRAPVEVADRDPIAPSRSGAAAALPRGLPSVQEPIVADKAGDKGQRPTDVREQAQAIFERRQPTLTSPAQVDAFLDELRATARAQHLVTAAEVEPGLMAIRQLTAQLSQDEVVQREVQFSQEMSRLSKEYREGLP